jgi:DNA-binding transcriptional LysR family regulator
MLDVDKLATLRVVLNCGSFSAAAHILHLTQPAVSRQISLLERRLGVELVRRTQRGVYPTEAGQLLATHTEAVLDRLERAEAELAELAGLRHGTLHLGSFFTAMIYLSAEVAIALGEQHPGLRIVDDLVDRDEALRKLARGQLDVAIVFEHDFEPAPVPDGINTITLFDDPLRALLPADHPLATRRNLRLQDLHDEIWIRAHDGSLARLTDQLLDANGMTPQLLLAGHGEEPIEAQALVAAGRGITLAHDLNVIVNPEHIAVRPLVGRTSVRHIQAAYLLGHRSPLVTAALDALQRIGQSRRAVHTADKTAAPAKREPTR